MRRLTAVMAVLITVGATALNPARAEPVPAGAGFGTEPGAISGPSPDGLGAWTVNYQRLQGSDATIPDAIPNAIPDAINDHIDAEANREVQQATWEGSKKRPWTFDAAGTLSQRPMTVSELFVGQYNTDEPNMPRQTVGSVVCDARSGVVINWDNLFRDKTEGLTRLAEQTEATMVASQPPDSVRDWRRNAQFTPMDINFKYWIPTAQGIELHFGEFQYGRGLKVVTVPWAKVADVIAPEFLPITG